MRRPVLAVIGLLALTACGGQPPATPSTTTTTTTSVSPVSSVSSSPTTTPPPVTTTTTVPPGKPAPVVVLDPGHNGANAANPGEINRQVPAGRGRIVVVDDDDHPVVPVEHGVAHR